jgi:hypothetical protein
LTTEQIRAVHLQFSELLAAFARQLPEDSERLAELVRDATMSIGELAADVAEGDADVASEIVMSTARLVGAVRKVVSSRHATSTLH